MNNILLFHYIFIKIYGTLILQALGGEVYQAYPRVWFHGKEEYATC